MQFKKYTIEFYNNGTEVTEKLKKFKFDLAKNYLILLLSDESYAYPDCSTAYNILMALSIGHNLSGLYNKPYKAMKGYFYITDIKDNSLIFVSAIGPMSQYQNYNQFFEEGIIGLFGNCGQIKVELECEPVGSIANRTDMCEHAINEIKKLINSEFGMFFTPPYPQSSYPGSNYGPAMANMNSQSGYQSSYPGGNYGPGTINIHPQYGVSFIPSQFPSSYPGGNYGPAMRYYNSYSYSNPSYPGYESNAQTDCPNQNEKENTNFILK